MCEGNPIYTLNQFRALDRRLRRAGTHVTTAHLDTLVARAIGPMVPPLPPLEMRALTESVKERLTDELEIVPEHFDVYAAEPTPGVNAPPSHRRVTRLRRAGGEQWHTQFDTEIQQRARRLAS